MRLSTTAGTSGYRGVTARMNAPSYSTSYIAGTYTPGIVARSRSTASRDARPPRFHAPTTSAISLIDFFAVADHERVDVLGERLGVVRAVPTRDDDRVVRRAVLVAHRHAGEVDAG